MDYQASSATLSKKLSNGHSFSSKSVYDGVFGAPSSKSGFSSRVEVQDYNEIFGGGSEASRGSSIPILDVPSLNERNVSVDIRSSKLDYSKVFGGFGELDYAVPFEELIISDDPKKKNGFPEKSQRTPAERESPSRGAVPSAFQEKNQKFSHEASYQSVDEVKKFSMSYNKINQEGKNGTNGKTHIAEIHAVPGYTCLIDETTPSQMNDSDKPLSSAVNDAYLSKKIGDIPAGGARKQNSKGGAEFQNNFNWYKSNSFGMLFGGHEHSHGTHSPNVAPSSNPLSKLGNGKVEPERPMASKFGVSRSGFECAECVSSPPYFDEEVDINSIAAASVAALKKAIEEAQARMKIAKESMERKKEGLQNRVKMSSSRGLKAERREGNIADSANRSKEKKDGEECKKVDAPVQNVMRAGYITSGFGEKTFNTKEAVAVGETCGREFKSTQADHRQGAAEQFHELANSGKQKATTLEFEQADNPKKETFEMPEECGERSNAVEQALEQEEIERKVNVVKGAFEYEKYGGKLNLSQQVHDQEENEKRLRVDQEQEVSKEKVNAFHEHEKYEEKLRDLQEQTDYEEKNEAQELGENENMKRQMEAQKSVEIEKEGKEDCEQEDTEKKQEATHKGEDSEESCVREIEKEQKDAHKGEDIEEACVLEIEKEQNDVHRGEDIEEACVLEIEKEQNDAHRGEDTEKWLDKVYEQAFIKKSFNDIQDEENIEKSFKENDKLEGNEKVQEARESEKILEGAPYQIEENEKRQKESCEWVEVEKLQTEINQSAEDDKILKAAQEALNYQVNNLEASDDQCKQDLSENPSKHQEASRHIKNNKDMELTLKVPAHEENGSPMEVNKASLKRKESWKKSEAVKDEKAVKVVKEALHQENNLEEVDDGCQQDEGENLSKNQEASRHRESDKDMEITLEEVDDGCQQDERENLSENQEASRPIESDKDMEITLDVTAHEENGSAVVVNKASFEHKENGKESETIEGANDMEDKGTLETAGFPQGAFKLIETNNQMEDLTEITSGKTDMNFGQKRDDQHVEEHKMVNNLGKYIEEFTPELGEIYKDVKEAEVAVNQEEDENSSKSSDVERPDDDGHNMKAAQLPSMFEEEGKTVEIAQEIKTTQSIKENHQSTLTTKEKEINGTLEKEHLKKIDEAKEREREKEKERIVVERAIREARERAFSEARERAERAAVERATTEARERAAVERAAAEARRRANEKSLGEKASMEAKLKAERAAVERATAEARERALEKAMSEKAAFDSRNQAEKFASTSNGMRHSASTHDPQYKGSGPSSSSRYSNSSSHGERFDGATSESAQRCKARSDRQQRIVERAEKALEEKNIRDHLAQKEQAERNRLAEALDGDVKRWSSGKEGNLRALLSTLHYVLGPDSGWQPIPLTDLIATSAAKKAYRKATLFVHPDKLQQRGASIQQKYTCEKVFDLLKEAWNRFNAEER